MSFNAVTGGEIFRPEAIAKGGKSQFPYLVDENTGKAMYESDEIIKYLFDTYGDGNAVSTDGVSAFPNY